MSCNNVISPKIALTLHLRMTVCKMLCLAQNSPDKNQYSRDTTFLHGTLSCLRYDFCTDTMKYSHKLIFWQGIEFHRYSTIFYLQMNFISINVNLYFGRTWLVSPSCYSLDCLPWLLLWSLVLCHPVWLAWPYPTPSV